MSTGPHNPPQRSTPYMCMPYRMWGGRSQNALRERVGRAAGVLKPCRSQARLCVLCALYVSEWVTRGTGPHNPPQRSTPCMCMPYRMWGGCSQNALRARERFGRVGRAAGVLKPCRSQARSCVLCALHVFEWVTRGTGPHSPPQRSTPYMCAIPYVGWTFTEHLARARARWTGRLPSQLVGGRPPSIRSTVHPHLSLTAT